MESRRSRTIASNQARIAEARKQKLAQEANTQRELNLEAVEEKL